VVYVIATQEGIVMKLLAAAGLALALLFAPTTSFAQETVTEGVPSLSVLPLDVNTCPDTHPIKGNKAGRQASRPVDPIYHVPASRWYAVTDPEECFATAEDAEAAGYRAPLR
jgi:hypothetical protein